MGLNEVLSAEIAVRSGSSPRSLRERLYALLGRMRFQLAGGVTCAVAIPAMLRWEAFEVPVRANNLSVIGSLWAFLFGYLIFRKVTAYPGVRATAYIIPAFMAAYATVATFFHVLRLDYSRTHLLISFLLTTAFFYLVFFLARRGRPLELAIIPVGDWARLKALSFVKWRTIDKPEQESSGLPIVADLTADLAPEWEQFIAASAVAGRPVYNSAQAFESLAGRVQIQRLSENTFGTLAPSAIYAPAKRYFDFIMALAALAILFPFLLLFALLVRLESPGPAIFRQERMGFRGKTFVAFKFRTMRIGADSEPGVAGAMTRPGDERITRLGQFMRRRRLDELPQLFNILLGEMSWIGPRPEALPLSQWYETQIPFYCYRHIVRPGVTGWAQVNQGHVTSLADADIKLQYDFFYVKNFSLWLDLLVLLKTVRVVLTGQGAK